MLLVTFQLQIIIIEIIVNMNVYYRYYKFIFDIKHTNTDDFF